MVYGDTGTGKTSVACDMAANAALGGSLFGLWQAVRPLRTYFVDTENPPAETRLAIDRIIGQDADAVKRVVVAEVIGTAFDIFDEVWQQRLKLALAEHKPDLLVLDNVSTIAPSRHLTRKPEDMAAFVALYRKLAREFRLTITLIHHTGKAQFSERGERLPTEAVGPTALKNDCDWIFALNQVKGRGKNLRRLVVEKMRSRRASVRPGQEFVLQWDEETYRFSLADKPDVMQCAGYLITKLGVRELGRRLGVSPSSVSNWKTGRREPDDSLKANIVKLAKEEGYEGSRLVHSILSS
jgi:RecA-family ATPase